MQPNGIVTLIPHQYGIENLNEVANKKAPSSPDLFDIQDVRELLLLEDIKRGGKLNQVSKSFYQASHNDSIKQNIVKLINEGVIDFQSLKSSFGIQTVQQLANYLGPECCVQILHLHGVPADWVFCENLMHGKATNSAFMDAVQKNFPNLKFLKFNLSKDWQDHDELFMNGFRWDTDLSVFLCKDGEDLKKLLLNDSVQISNLQPLALSKIEFLNISGCKNITDFKFLLSMRKLRTLYAVGLDIPQDILISLKKKSVHIV